MKTQMAAYPDPAVGSRLEALIPGAGVGEVERAGWGLWSA